MELVHRVTRHLENVEVKSFEGLAVDFVQKCDAKVMIRGVRPLTDIAAEFTMMMANRQLDPDIEISRINRWQERPAWKKASSYIIARAKKVCHTPVRFVHRPVSMEERVGEHDGAT